MYVYLNMARQLDIICTLLKKKKTRPVQGATATVVATVPFAPPAAPPLAEPLGPALGAAGAGTACEKLGFCQWKWGLNMIQPWLNGKSLI